MPTMVLLAAHLTIAANDLSDRCSKIELTAEVEEKEVTTYASLGWKEVTGGLASGALALGLKNDYAAAELDSIMWALFLTRTPQDFAVRASNAAASANNPEYSGKILIKEWKPINGAVGDVAELDVTYPTSGVIDRAVA
ncbi:hypothetical protein Aph01nite_74040 [Acrocarpospora phusangensis]|uniref:Uncharacterized protein n=1 Tax=Acrocarpospora phusangensis TaxID=1070424 RepID=A0A919QJA0_9ACTN|nr:hypothetical protein [Acrocarpospora phusangensis]GIH29094.1 hypothetical protein Aph01nite_74040 [Acrocarpospora phusangensis]